MGTSKSISTPSGGAWSPLKQDITSQFGPGTPRCSPSAIVGRTVQAAGGVGGLSTSDGSGGGGGRGGGGATARASRAVSGLGGFGATVAAEGLGAALDSLGLGELRGQPAAEVVARVADHLASHADGLDRDLLSGALRDALLEVANLDDTVEYDDLGQSLETLLEANGVEGLIDVFLANLVYDQVWTLIEHWSLEKSASNTDLDALRGGVEAACRQLVRDTISDLKDDGRFESTDWFGTQGAELGRTIVRDVETRLNDAAEEGD